MEYINDANILQGRLDSISNASAIIRVLAFEILLKCAIYLNNGKLLKGHNYDTLWEKLSTEAKEEIEKTAQERMPAQVDLSNIPNLLKELTDVFMDGRYLYEKNEGMTREEVKIKGQSWVHRGAPLEEADIQYFPEELECLICGLKSHIESKI
jgi:HEPN domain-containing protein